MIVSIVGICGLVSLICWIYILVKTFQAGKIGLGILGIICGLFAYIYGWAKAAEFHARAVMVIWTLSIIGSAVIVGSNASAFVMIPGIPKLPNMPNVPNMPPVPNMPNLPQAPKLPAPPKVPSMPNMP
jgi:hypothetical protein